METATVWGLAAIAASNASVVGRIFWEDNEDEKAAEAYRAAAALYELAGMDCPAIEAADCASRCGRRSEWRHGRDYDISRGDW